MSNIIPMLRIAVLLTLLFLVTNLFAFPFGITKRTGSPTDILTCNECHKSNATGSQRIAPVVILEGPRTVTANSTNHYTLVLTGGQKKVGGLNVGVDKGLLVETDQYTRLKLIDPNDPLSEKQIVHIDSTPVGADGTTIKWTFDWTAPDTEGVSTIYASGLSANLDGKSLGDISTSIAEAIQVTLEPPTPVPPVAYINAPKSASIGTNITFDGSASFDGDGSISSYSWKIDGITVETTPQITYAFTTADVSTVELTVTDNDGKTDKTFVDITIVNVTNGGTLVPKATITMPQTADTGIEVSFDAVDSVTTNTRNIKYIWDFGDGSNLELSQLQTSTMTHVFSGANKYTVSLAVQDGPLTGITTSEITITDSVVVTPPPVKTGANLYKLHCESCHGVAGIGISGVAKKIIGSTNQLILDAISTTALTSVPSMASIVLEAGDAQLIAGYLGSAAGTTADRIYINKCELCHGVNGQGAVYKKIRNASAQMISNSVNQLSTPVIPLMKGIALSTGDDALLATFLKDVVGVETGKTLYDTLCAICHGPNGTGGTAKLIVNTTLAVVNTAITTQPAMSGIPEITALTIAQRQKIIDYLKSNITVPGDPNAGEVVYKAKCQVCHGTGTGGMAVGILNSSVFMIENAIINIPIMQTIVLSTVNNDKQNLVALLARGTIAKPTTGGGLFAMYCSYCHGVDGMGGAFKNAPIKALGITAQLIIDAYTGGEPEMSASNLRNAGLTLSDRQAIANWLK